MLLTHDVHELPFASSTPSIARTKLAAFLTVNRVPLDTIDNALMILSELIANAVAHGVPKADGTMEIEWSIRESRLELAVSDAGQCPEFAAKPFDEDSLNGRGLSIISRLADSWSVDQSDGTRVRAEMALR